MTVKLPHLRALLKDHDTTSSSRGAQLHRRLFDIEVVRFGTDKLKWKRNRSPHPRGHGPQHPAPALIENSIKHGLEPRINGAPSPAHRLEATVSYRGGRRRCRHGNRPLRLSPRRRRIGMKTFRSASKSSTAPGPLQNRQYPDAAPDSIEIPSVMPGAFTGRSRMLKRWCVSRCWLGSKERPLSADAPILSIAAQLRGAVRA